MSNIDRSVISAKDLKLLQPTLYSYISTLYEFGKHTTALFDFMAHNKLDPHIQGIYTLEDVARAHGDSEGRKTMGKPLPKP